MDKDQASRSADTRPRGKNSFRVLMTPEKRTKRVQKRFDTMNKDQDRRSADARPRDKKPFAVLMTPEERAKIERNAAAKGLTASAYLRTLGLGYEPKPVLDPEHVYNLLKLGGELVRLSGLLRLWLNEQPDRGVPEIDVQQLLAQITETRGQIADKLMEMQI
jgi:hypothetical protein